MSGLGSLAGGVIGGMYGGPWGAAAGSAAGGALGGQLGNLMGGFSGSGVQGAPMNYNIDPRASSVYEATWDKYRNMLQTNQGMLDQYQGGPESTYVQAMVNPTIQANASNYGNVLQDQALRGIRGSSFGDLGVQNLVNQANTSVSDIRAKAMANQLGQQESIMGQRQNILGGMMDIGKLYQQQGLGALQAATGYNEAKMKADAAAQSANAGLFGGLMSGLGGMMGGGTKVTTDYSSPVTSQSWGLGQGPIAE